MKFFFAWVEEDEEFSEHKHLREDLKVFKFSLSQRETEVATVRLLIPVIDINNLPHKWALMSLKTKSGEIKPIFKGAFYDVPRILTQDLMELEFSSEPYDASSKIANLTDELRKDPSFEEAFYNDVGLSQLLEAKAEVISWDRLTGALTTSHFFKGKDKFDFSEDFYTESLKVKTGSTPFSCIHLELVAEWTQKAEGEFNLFPLIKRKFLDHQVNTLTPKSLLRGWPREGNVIGSKSIRKRYHYHIKKSVLKSFVPYKDKGLNAFEFCINDIKGNRLSKKLKRWWFQGSLWIGWDLQQPCKERVELCVKNNHQNQTLKGWERKLKFSIKNAERFLDTPNSFSVFQTTRGQKLIDYALSVAKAHLAGSFRQLEVEFCVPLEKALDVTLDASVFIKHPTYTIPFEGKVIAYRFLMDADHGFAWIKLGCFHKEAMNYENLPTLNAVYIDDTYMDEKYGGDKTEKSISLSKVSGHLPLDTSLLTENDMVKDIHIKGDGAEQIRKLQDNNSLTSHYREILNDERFSFEIVLKDLSPLPLCESLWKASDVYFDVRKEAL